MCHWVHAYYNCGHDRAKRDPPCRDSNRGRPQCVLDFVDLPRLERRSYSEPCFGCKFEAQSLLPSSPPRQTRPQKKRSSREVYEDEDGSDPLGHSYTNQYDHQMPKRSTTRDLNLSAPSKRSKTSHDKWSSDALQAIGRIGTPTEEPHDTDMTFADPTTTHRARNRAQNAKQQKIKRKPVPGHRSSPLGLDLPLPYSREADYGFAGGAESPYASLTQHESGDSRISPTSRSPPVSPMSIQATELSRHPTQHMKDLSPTFRGIRDRHRPRKSLPRFHEDPEEDMYAAEYHAGEAQYRQAQQYGYEQPAQPYYQQQPVRFPIQDPEYDRAYNEVERLVQSSNYSLAQVRQWPSYQRLHCEDRTRLLTHYAPQLAHGAKRQRQWEMPPSSSEAIRQRARTAPSDSWWGRAKRFFRAG